MPLALASTGAARKTPKSYPKRHRVPCSCFYRTPVRPALAVVAHLRSSVDTCSRPPSRTPLAVLRLGARRSAPGVGRGRPRRGSPIVLAPPYYFQASAATCSRPPSCGPSAVHRPGKAAIHNPLFEIRRARLRLTPAQRSPLRARIWPRA
jgi:hypothetical protein